MFSRILQLNECTQTNVSFPKMNLVLGIYEDAPKSMTKIHTLNMQSQSLKAVC